MPGLGHAVTRSLGGNGQTIELAGQAHGKVADIDHFLNFTQTLLVNLAAFHSHQSAEGLLMFPELVAEHTN